MISKLLIFRFRQLFRMLREIGAAYLIVVFILLFGALMGGIEQLVASQNPSFGLFGIMIALAIHLNRKDGRFLTKLQVSTYKLFAAEYLLLTVPLALLFLYSGNYLAILIQSIGVVLLSFIKPFMSEKGGLTSRLDFGWISPKAFEAKSYFRKNLIPIGFIYVLLLGTAKFVAPALLAALLIAITFTAFFDEVESKELFECFHFKKGILQSKIKVYLGLYYMLLIPHAVLFLVLHFQYWYLLLAAVFLGTTLSPFQYFLSLCTFYALSTKSVQFGGKLIFYIFNDHPVFLSSDIDLFIDLLEKGCKKYSILLC